MDNKIIHNCKKLSEYNQETWHGPVAIQYTEVLIRGGYDWQLLHLEVDENDWDDRYVVSAGVIGFCPFCGKRLVDKKSIQRAIEDNPSAAEMLTPEDLLENFGL